jgi:diguanylate cyclase (GGDEF)-like protein
MELSLQVAELDAAMTRDETARFRQILAEQRRVRVGAIIALAIVAIFVRGAALSAVAISASVAGAYILFVLRIGVVAKRAERTSRKSTISLNVADALGVTFLCAAAGVAGGGDTLMWILVAGAIAAPAMTYAFGHKAGITSFSLFGASYIVTELLFRGFDVAPENPIVPVASLALWGAGVWTAVRHLAKVRQRIDSLRTYAKLAEVGDVGTSDLLTESGDRDDDFALIAKSLDVVHARLADQIGRDALTGCSNRRGLERQLMGACRLAKRRDGVVAVAAIDIDHFKQINDAYGHPEGDRVLRQLATIMMNTARETDTVARLGGDEFVIVLPDSDWHGARAFAERLRAHVADTSFGPPGGSLTVTLSIGVAVAQDKEELEPDLLLSNADQALYDAKSGGRDRVAARGSMSG